MKNNETEMEPGTTGVYWDLHSKALPYTRTVKLNRFEILLNKYETIISERSFIKGKNLSTRHLRRILKWLDDNDYISINSTNKGTIIKINNPNLTVDHLS